MGYPKTIVCLANSRKPSGRCLAGREITASGFGPWIRPVSARATREISESERNDRNGRDPSLLDVLEIQMLTPLPQHHQTENHLIDAQYFWEKKGQVTWAAIQLAVENPGSALWENGYSSSAGHNDRVPEHRAHALTRSLYLIRPQELSLCIAMEGGDFGPSRRRVRAQFSFAGQTYKLAVSDPVVEALAAREPVGTYPKADALLCVSLAEVFYGYAYKLVAAVITEKRVPSA